MDHGLDGTRCRIVLPVSQLASPERQITLSLDQKHILVVEDEFLLARDLTKALEQAGANVIGPVPSVERAMTRLRHEPLDAAVLDINVRGENVFALADLLKERAIPIVFATGHQDLWAGRGYSEAPCLLKPVDLREIVEVLDRVIGPT